MKIRDDIHTVRSELDAAMGPKEPEKQSRARRVATRIFFLVGVAGVAVMVWRLDISKVDWPNLVRHMPYWIPALMLLWAGIYAVHSLSYRLILGEDAGRDEGPSFIPAILRQPEDQAGRVGQTVTFTVEAENVASYRWQFHNGRVWKDCRNPATRLTIISRPTVPMGKNIRFRRSSRSSVFRA